MAEESFRVSGMHCNSCALSIERALRKKSGVKKAQVNFALNKLYITYDPSVITPKSIEKEVRKLGYKLIKADNSKDESYYSLKRVLLSFLFSVPLVYLSMGDIFSLYIPPFFLDNFHILQFSFASLVVLINLAIWKNGFLNLIHLRPNMESLIFIGTFTSYLYSGIVVALGLSDFHIYFESSALILTFVSLGKFLEEKTKMKASEALRKLFTLTPQEAVILVPKSKVRALKFRLNDYREMKVPTEDIKVKDLIVVRPGEKIPADGVVVDGYSAVDEKAITGESIPVEKKKKDKVFAGTLNTTGFLVLRVEKVGQDMTISQVIKVMENALSNKAPVQALADKVSYYFVPAVIIIALISFVFWYFSGKPLDFALTSFVSVLVIACPCALGLATPTALIVGVETAAKRGILIKDGKVLEKASLVNVVVFDKTGTLTKGEPEVTDIFPVKKNIDRLIDGTLFKNGESLILQIAASLEKKSEHPFAKAIVKEARQEEIKFLEVSHFSALPGHGVCANIKFRNRSRQLKVIFGTKKLMLDNNVKIKLVQKEIANLESQGKTVIILSLEKKVLGIIALADGIKEDSKKAIERLIKMNKGVVMLTGDSEKVAKRIAGKIGIKKLFWGVLPQEKLVRIREIQDKGNVVAFVGDGINDAPALAQADVGIALGNGTDVAIETGDMVLLRPSLMEVPYSLALSNYTFSKIKQNLFWAFFYNILGVPIAAGVFYPITGLLLNPSLAALAMAFSSVSVISNSLLIRNR